jgi:hypothetical protein
VVSRKIISTVAMKHVPRICSRKPCISDISDMWLTVEKE